MKIGKITLCYHYNDFAAIHGPGHLMHGYTLLISMNQRISQKAKQQVIHNQS